MCQLCRLRLFVWPPVVLVWPPILLAGPPVFIVGSSVVVVGPPFVIVGPLIVVVGPPVVIVPNGNRNKQFDEIYWKGFFLLKIVFFQTLTTSKLMEFQCIVIK